MVEVEVSPTLAQGGASALELVGASEAEIEAVYRERYGQLVRTAHAVPRAG